MVDAVSSAISNIQIAAPAQTQAAAQIAAQQISSSSSADSDSVARAPVAPFISPYISLDNSGIAVLQIRNSDTGEVENQFPSEPTIQQRQAQAARRESQRGEVVQQEPANAQQTQNSSTTFQTSIIAQQSSASSSNVGAPAGIAQAAIAALSAGAQSGQGGNSFVNSITA